MVQLLPRRFFSPSWHHLARSRATTTTTTAVGAAAERSNATKSSDTSATTSTLSHRNHREIPHHLALQHPHHLFKVRTRWIAKSLASGKLQPSPNSKIISKILSHRRIDPETFGIWIEILQRRDVVYSLTRLGLLESAGEGRDVIPCPNWLYLSIPYFIKEKNGAPYLAAMFLSSKMSELTEQERGLLASRCLGGFIRVGHYVAAREMVDWICHEDQESQLGGSGGGGGKNPSSIETYTNCLSALTSHPSRAGTFSAPPPNFLPSLSALLQNTMSLRKIAHNSDSYEKLFHRSLIPEDPKVASELLFNMQEKGFEPPSRVLQVVMGSFARKGRNKEATALMVVIEDQRVMKLPRYDTTEVEYDTPTQFLRRESNLDPQASPSTPPLPIVGTHATTYLDSLSLDPSIALSYFSSLRHLSPKTVDLVTWSSMIRTVCRHPKSTIEEILSILNSAEQQALWRRSDRTPSLSYRSRRLRSLGKDPLLHIRIYTIVMNSLVRKGAPSRVSTLWEELVERGIKPDSVMLSAVCDAHYALGDIDSAMRVLDFYALIDGPTTATDVKQRRRRLRPTRQSILASSIPLKHSVKLDIVNINHLLVALSRSGKYAAVYDMVFHRLSTDYGIESNGIDATTLSILIDTSRFASAAAGRGWGPGTERLKLGADKEDGVSGWEDDTWGGVKASLFMERLVWRTLESGWPKGVEWVRDWDCLNGINGTGYSAKRDGEVAVGSTGDAGLLGWVRDKFRGNEDHHRHRHTADIPHHFSSTLSLTHHGPPLFPQIVPSLSIFRSLIQLLGYHSTPIKISKCLTWMRYLDSKPTRNTLVLAMMYIGEGDPSEASRRRMGEWLSDWLGEENVPREAEIAFVRSGGHSGRKV